MMFSILTATYNRAHTLPKVYLSLCQQSVQDFEWLIMDDGSSDSTKQLVQSWLAKSKLKIRWFEQPNGGKHHALNGIIKEAKGKFSIILDSDDALTPKALERFLYHWETIPEAKRSEFSGISGLCQSETGKVLGQHIPGGVLDTTNMEVMYIYKLGGDRKSCILTEIQKNYLYPEFEGEKFITDSIVWQKMGRSYKFRYVNEVVCITDYLEDGLTKDQRKLLRSNPKGSAAYYKHGLDDPAPLSLKVRLGLHAYYVRYALHAAYSFPQIIKNAYQRPILLMLGMILGAILFFRDKLQDLMSLFLI